MQDAIIKHEQGVTASKIEKERPKTLKSLYRIAESACASSYDYPFSSRNRGFRMDTN